jgi:hypothetical protein
MINAQNAAQKYIFILKDVLFLWKNNVVSCEKRAFDLWVIDFCRKKRTPQYKRQTALQNGICKAV